MNFLVKARVAITLGLLWTATTALHGGTISDVVFRLDAANDAGSGFLEFHASDLTYDAGMNSWNWATSAIRITDSDTGVVIAQLDSASLGIILDPLPIQPYRISLALSVHAGTSVTLFTVQSAQLTFPVPLTPDRLQAPDGGGRATASVGLFDAKLDGGEIVAAGPHANGIYEAYYNGWSPGGTVFAALVHLIKVGPDGSATASQTFPVGNGRTSINTTISDMSAGLFFTLTPNDAASASTQYYVLPMTPGDLNCDGSVNLGDINPFVLALSNPARYHATYPTCNILNGDINNDGYVNVRDINGFLRLLGADDTLAEPNSTITPG
jgi:hypothetical protein